MSLGETGATGLVWHFSSVHVTVAVVAGAVGFPSLHFSSVQTVSVTTGADDDDDDGLPSPPLVGLPSSLQLSSVQTVSVTTGTDGLPLSVGLPPSVGLPGVMVSVTVVHLPSSWHLVMVVV